MSRRKEEDFLLYNSRERVQLTVDTILLKIFSSLLFGSKKLLSVLQRKTVRFTTNISIHFSRKAAITALRKRAQSVTVHTSLLNVSSYFFK
jgi:hypothetical protein